MGRPADRLQELAVVIEYFCTVVLLLLLKIIELLPSLL